MAANDTTNPTEFVPNDAILDMTPEPRVDTSFLNAGPVARPHTQRQAHTTPGTPLRATKGDIFRSLTQALTINDFGVPDFIYRADLIPVNIFQVEPLERRDLLESAIVPITFEYGYPSIDGATPLWERLPGESQAAYDAYCLALDLPEVSKAETPVRLLPILAQMLKLPLSQLAEYCHIYYWHIRFRSYDLYLAACHRKQREQRIMTIEGKHFTMAERYLAKVDKVLEAKLDHVITEMNDPDSAEMDEMKLKDLVDMVEKLTRIQRISVGLPANGNDTSPDRQIGGRLQSVEDSYKEIAQNAQPAKKRDNRSADMDQLLANPEDLAAAQDLLIKFHQQGVK